jgi:hypothetical protein
LLIIGENFHYPSLSFTLNHPFETMDVANSSDIIEETTHIFFSDDHARVNNTGGGQGL